MFSHRFWTERPDEAERYVMAYLQGARDYYRAFEENVNRDGVIGGLAAVTKDVIPYGLVWGNHAHLEGLNLVGLKRRSFGRETIAELRAAYRSLFAEEGTFQERIDDTADTFKDSAPVMEIVAFIRAEAGRPLCLPAREV